MCVCMSVCLCLYLIVLGSHVYAVPIEAEKDIRVPGTRLTHKLLLVEVVASSLYHQMKGSEMVNHLANGLQQPIQDVRSLVWLEAHLVLSPSLMILHSSVEASWTMYFLGRLIPLRCLCWPSMSDPLVLLRPGGTNHPRKEDGSWCCTVHWSNQSSQ